MTKKNLDRLIAPDDLAVETIGLTKRFPARSGFRYLRKPSTSKPVLDSLSLAVRRGEIFGLLGPNGAGKTTLAKILCTLITPTAGIARVAGFDVVRDEAEVRRRVGLIYGDQRSFFLRLSFIENLRFYAALYALPTAVARKRIDDLVERVGLSEAADMRMFHFSSGMKQRAAIARGLLNEPEILLLDEPTVAVDPIATYEIRKMIREMIVQDGWRTVLLTTNMMEEAEQLCDRIALLNRGRIEMAGTVATLRARFQPDSQYVLRVSGLLADALPQLQAIPGVDGISQQVVDPGLVDLTITVRANELVIPQVIRRLVGMSADIWGCTKRELSLDEMFRLSFADATTRQDQQNTEASLVGSAG